ncbi:MAG: hypothetical protein AABX17_03940 [Nanoarchaeota archaeon]
MENKNIGWLIVGISAFIGIIISIFYFGVNKIIGATCSHGPSCGMYATLKIQTWISISIALVVLLIGLFFIFAKEKEKIVTRTIKEKRKEIDVSKLDKDEKEVIKILQSENGAIFQSTLMEKLNIGKVGMTRLIDKLEAKQIVERKRRGMNNIVVLK